MDIAEEDIEIVLRSPQLPSTLLEAAIPIRHFREKWLGSGKKRVECLLIVSGVCLPRRFAVFSSSLSCGRDLGPRHKPTGPPPGYHARWKVESTKRDVRRPSRRGITIEKSRTEPGWRLSAPHRVTLPLPQRMATQLDLHEARFQRHDELGVLPGLSKVRPPQVRAGVCLLQWP